MGVLEGKVALVIGAGRGIGLATARLFAAEGARLVVADVGCDPDGRGEDPSVATQVVDELGAGGGEAVAFTESCATEAGATRAVELARSRFGALDTVVHAAGILADQPLSRVDAATWGRVVAAHLDGALFATRAAAAAMQRGGGRIVLTTSSAGLLGNFGQPAYSAAAAGIYGLMRSASIELQRLGVFVNAVAPLAKTRLTATLPMFEHVDTMTPEHAAPAYLFFGSDLSGDLTGNVLGVAGGRIGLYKVTETAGHFKEADRGVWKASEIRDEWSGMARAGRAGKGDR